MCIKNANSNINSRNLQVVYSLVSMDSFDNMMRSKTLNEMFVYFDNCPDFLPWDFYLRKTLSSGPRFMGFMDKLGNFEPFWPFRFFHLANLTNFIAFELLKFCRFFLNFDQFLSPISLFCFWYQVWEIFVLQFFGEWYILNFWKKPNLSKDISILFNKSLIYEAL